tara:strand:- start:922 stop:1056 length:135 start_codon:yes stop_codon:yes gene_type:complete
LRELLSLLFRAQLAGDDDAILLGDAIRLRDPICLGDAIWFGDTI